MLWRSFAANGYARNFLSFLACLFLCLQLVFTTESGSWLDMRDETGMEHKLTACGSMGWEFVMIPETDFACGLGITG
jgi:hypothetical protein